MSAPPTPAILWVGDSLDDIYGILLAKDLLPQILCKDQSEFNIRKLLRPTVVVPESKRLNVLLREFRENRNHMAIVIDEYGGVAGLGNHRGCPGGDRRRN